MPHVAVVNFAQTVDHLGSDAMKGFLALTPAVYAQANNSSGFVASAHPIDEREDLSFFERQWGEWGTFVVPSYYVGGRTATSVYEASALSVWRDIPSLYSFVYQSFHLRAIQRKASWFTRMKFPNYAVWWCEELPTWKEGAARLEHLHAHAETPHAFTFRKLYDQTGAAIELSKMRTGTFDQN